MTYTLVWHTNKAQFDSIVAELERDGWTKEGQPEAGWRLYAVAGGWQKSAKPGWCVGMFHQPPLELCNFIGGFVPTT